MIEKIYLIAIFGILIFASCTYINDRLGLTVQEEENFAEEVIETVIQMETGYRPPLKEL